MVSSGEGKQEAAISHSGGGGSSGKGSLDIRSRSKEIEEPLVLGYREQGVSLKSKIWSPVSEGERSKLRVGGGSQGLCHKDLWDNALQVLIAHLHEDNINSLFCRKVRLYWGVE